jgi:type I restriction enzyme, S subunit
LILPGLAASRFGEASADQRTTDGIRSSIAAYGGRQPTLNIKQLSETTVGLPPIELQREFARRVRAVEKLKMAQRASLAELDALFATLQHRAFREEL